MKRSNIGKGKPDQKGRESQKNVKMLHDEGKKRRPSSREVKDRGRGRGGGKRHQYPEETTRKR